MHRFAVTAFLACAFAMILDLRVVDATAISTDLDLSQFCADCALLVDDTNKTNLDWPKNTKTTHDFTSCKYYGEIDCVNLDDALSVETETENIKSIIAQIGSTTSGLGILVEYRDAYQENRDCTYFESKLHDARRVHEECGNVEPGSDYSELVSVISLTTVSVISFALLAGVWLLLRSFRNWKLRNMILTRQNN